MRIKNHLSYLLLLMTIFTVPWVAAQGSYPAQETKCQSNADVLFVCGVINPGSISNSRNELGHCNRKNIRFGRTDLRCEY